MRLRIAGSELTVSAEDLDFANEATERLACSYHGEDIEVAPTKVPGHAEQPFYEEVNLELSAPNRAGIIRPSEPEEAGEDVLMLVMPVMLGADLRPAAQDFVGLLKGRVTSALGRSVLRVFAGWFAGPPPFRVA